MCTGSENGTRIALSSPRTWLTEGGASIDEWLTAAGLTREETAGRYRTYRFGG